MTKIKKGICGLCYHSPGCGAIVHFDDRDRIERLEPDPDMPMGSALCPIADSAKEIIYSKRRLKYLLVDLIPLSHHNDFKIAPDVYDEETDTIHFEVRPRSSPEWAKMAYKFAKQEGMKYDRNTRVYDIDGQPRVTFSGDVWVRYVGDFLDGSKVAFHIWSQQPSHRDAEEQLLELYGRFMEFDGLSPPEVFKKYT